MTAFKVSVSPRGPVTCGYAGTPVSALSPAPRPGRPTRLPLPPEAEVCLQPLPSARVLHCPSKVQVTERGVHARLLGPCLQHGQSTGQGLMWPTPSGLSSQAEFWGPPHRGAGELLELPSAGLASGESLWTRGWRAPRGQQVLTSSLPTSEAGCVRGDGRQGFCWGLVQDAFSQVLTPRAVGGRLWCRLILALGPAGCPQACVPCVSVAKPPRTLAGIVSSQMCSESGQ